MSITINGTNGLVFNDGSSQNTAATGFGFKNRIINGAMMVDQRNAGASVTPTSSGTYLVDRFNSINNQASKLTYQQSTTVPVGFKNSLSITTASAYTPATSETFGLRQHIEGFNVADLGFGTASAQTVTLSFWVRSSLTGTFGGTLMNNAGNRFYVFSYSISATNTWEQKTVTIAGDTTGTWETGNLAGITLTWSVGTGATLSGAAGSWGATAYYGVTGGVQPVATAGATFYITGVQLEKGSTATSFDYRPYGTEDILCKRYREVVPIHFGFDAGTGTMRNNYKWVEKRATPTATLAVQYWNGSSWTTPLTTAVNAGTGGGYINVTGTSMRFVGHGTSQYQGLFECGALTLDSEL